MDAPVNKYKRLIFGVERSGSGWVDVYSVLEAFEVYDPAVAHAVKKLLAAGNRGVKTFTEDVREAKQALDRALDLAVDREARWEMYRNDNEVKEALDHAAIAATESEQRRKRRNERERDRKRAKRAAAKASQRPNKAARPRT